MELPWSCRGVAVECAVELPWSAVECRGSPVDRAHKMHKFLVVPFKNYQERMPGKIIVPRAVLHGRRPRLYFSLYTLQAILLLGNLAGKCSLIICHLPGFFFLVPLCAEEFFQPYPWMARGVTCLYAMVEWMQLVHSLVSTRVGVEGSTASFIQRGEGGSAPRCFGAGQFAVP